MSAVDWKLATAIGRRMVPPSPVASRAEIELLVTQLHESAERAPALIAAVSGLPNPGTSRVLVLDRPSAVEAAVETAKSMLARFDELGTATGVLDRVQARFTGAGLGGAVSLLGTRILGQYDPFHDPARLILVAPNVLKAERELSLPAEDFRLWICLHEQTHRVQFESAPWLVDYIVAVASRLMEAEEKKAVDWSRISKVRDSKPGPELMVQLLGAEAEDAFNEITAVMSLLEGHADVMMDRVPRDVIATVPRIRASFNKRRGKFSLVGQLIGMETKLAQYRDGAKFCKQVIAESGVEGLNRAFAGPDQLPTIHELHDPTAWLRRVNNGS